MPVSNEMKYSLILASQSPRRKEILNYLGIPFLIKPAGIKEISQKKGHHEIVLDIARKKGLAALAKEVSNEDFKRSYFPVIVASDTIVCLEQKIMGKPEDINEARVMLRELAGRSHKVLTGIYIGFHELTSGKYKEVCFSCETIVEFDSFSDDTLEQYLATNDSLDKAGAYGVQGPGQTLIKGLKGSYSNVVGFPIANFIPKFKLAITSEDGEDVQFRSLFHGSP